VNEQTRTFMAMHEVAHDCFNGVERLLLREHQEDGSVKDTHSVSKRVALKAVVDVHFYVNFHWF
jgi:hypothetical protein